MVELKIRATGDWELEAQAGSGGASALRGDRASHPPPPAYNKGGTLKALNSAVVRER